MWFSKKLVFSLPLLVYWLALNYFVFGGFLQSPQKCLKLIENVVSIEVVVVVVEVVLSAMLFQVQNQLPGYKQYLEKQWIFNCTNYITKKVETIKIKKKTTK